MQLLDALKSRAYADPAVPPGLAGRFAAGDQRPLGIVEPRGRCPRDHGVDSEARLKPDPHPRLDHAEVALHVGRALPIQNVAHRRLGLGTCDLAAIDLDTDLMSDLAEQGHGEVLFVEQM